MEFRLHRWNLQTWSVCCPVLLGMDPAELGQFWCKASASTYGGSSACGAEGAASETVLWGGVVLSLHSQALCLGQRLILERRKELGEGSWISSYAFFFFFFFVWSLWDFSFCVTTVVSWAENWKYNVKAHKFNIRWKGCRMNKYICLPGNILLTSLHPDQALLSQACKLLQEALFQEISLPFGCPGPLGTAK